MATTLMSLATETLKDIQKSAWGWQYSGLYICFTDYCKAVFSVMKKMSLFMFRNISHLATMHKFRLCPRIILLLGQNAFFNSVEIAWINN